jgi:putative restriction endonuclease
MILDEFKKLAVWRRAEERAPHKPLLVLYAIGRLIHGKRDMLFSEIEEPLTILLKEYGPDRKVYHPEYPFWFLQSDGFWLLDNAEKCRVRVGNTNAPAVELRKHMVTGYFRKDIQEALIANKLLIAEIAAVVLESHFPTSLHSEILEACGIQLEFSRAAKKRDPAFRERILRAYQYRCAVCGFRAQMSGRHLALEAAHIKWHAAGGPDVESNGIAMCSLHHKLFDKGAFMFEGTKLLLSESLYSDSENRTFADMLMSFHGTELGRPIRREYMPKDEWMKWHATQVFRGPVLPVVHFDRN